MVALITGGTGGLGTAMVRAFLDAGHAVVTTYRKPLEAEQARANLGEAAQRLVLEQVDVTDRTAVDDLVLRARERFGRVDSLVNLVGAWAGGQPVWETSDEDLDRMLDTNLRSAFVCCRAVLPGMIERRSGSIVNVSSRSAVQPSPGSAPYAIGKAGVITLTQTLAVETQDHGITVNCVLPSVIDTEANRRSMPDADFARWVKPEQLAAVIRWLTSAEASPISGAAIPVYGRA